MVDKIRDMLALQLKCYVHKSRMQKRDMAVTMFTFSEDSRCRRGQKGRDWYVGQKGNVYPVKCVATKRAYGYGIVRSAADRLCNG